VPGYSPGTGKRPSVEEGSVSDLHGSAASVSPLVGHVAGASTEDGTGNGPAAGHLTARHYGSPLVEQQRRDEGVPGVVDGWDHVALVVEGAGGREWINGFISQKTDAMSTGTATSSLLLDAHGRVEQVFGIAAPADGVLLLDVAAERADALQDFLTKMMFWADVTVQRPALARLSVVGTLPGTDSPGPGRSGTDAPAAVPSAAYWTTRTAGALPVTDLWVPRDAVADAWDALVAAGAEPTGGMAADALRVRDRRPLLGVDTDARLIPHEVPAFLGTVGAEATRLADAAEGPTAAAVHLNKGCYRGQETVSRVQNLGQPPRRLVLLQLDGSLNQMPAVGADITAGGRTVGRIGRTVQDADFGPVALALVKRQVIEAVAAGTAPPLEVDGVAAAVDPDDLRVDDSVKPGRAAVDRLRGKA
jgi:folate-binding Fe-S cluster repair protein YgfZ